MAAALGLTASVIAVLNLTMATISTCYSYGSGVKNASKDKKKIIDQLRGLQSVLEGVRALVEDEELKASSRLPAVLELLNDSSNGLSRCHAELAALKTKLEPKARHTDRIQALIWPFKEGEVKKTLHHLGQFQQRLDSTLSVDQTRLTLEIHTSVVEERRQEIYTWLSTHDYQSKHTNAYKERQETTGSWFLQGRPFEEWKCRDNSFLWLHGIPGAGKTILCSTIIEELFCHCKSHASFVTAYFYFDFHDKDTRPEVALGSLVEQLSMQCGSFPDALTQLFSENGKNRAPPPQHLMAVLKAVIGSFRNVYIVFDALDECPQRAELLNLLREINDWGLGTLHLLVTSRRERDLEEALDSFVSHHVPLEQRVVDHDIRVHVSKTLDRDIKFKRYSTEDKKMIESTLTEGAHGMFRLVACQLDVLRKCYSPAELMKALNSLPRTLYETYDRMLSSIPEEHRRDTLRVLQWLAFSVRTISLQEAVEVLATDPDEEDGPLFDVRGRLWDPRNIVAICSSLITIAVPAVNTHAREGRIGRASTAGLEELKLAHFSVREYLVSEHLRKSDVALSWFHFNKRIADTYIAKTCLAYLLQFTDHKWVPLKTAKTSPLSAYAARHWIVHAQSDTDGASESLHRLMMALLQPKDAVYKNWLQLYNGDPSGAPITASRETCPPLYYTSMAGLERASRCLLESGSDMNVQKGRHGSALQVAAFKGRYAIVRLLLEKGAEINPQGGVYGSALQAAAIEGLDENDFWFPKTRDDVNAQSPASTESYAMIIQLLLEKGAEVNAKGGRYGSPLQAASFRGHSGIVRSLLEKGADVSVLGGKHGSALQAASFRGHDAIVRLLLEKGADVDAKGGRYGSPLQAASFRGHSGIVRLLLEKGADVSVLGGEHGSALQAASFKGHSGIVHLLLEKRAGVSVLGGEDGSALQAASLQGHRGIAQLLLEKGADPSAQGGVYGNALQAASFGGHDAIVRLLLENGADVDANGGKYGSALQAASSRGHSGIVRLLLEKGADVNVQGGDYGSALQAASSGAHEGIVRLLLANGADVNIPGIMLDNALTAASLKGNDVIVQLLLDKGANVNVQGWYCGSALHAASSVGHDTIVRLLLEEGADVNAQGEESALQAASSKGYDVIVRLLLENGADVNARGRLGGALQCAVLKGHYGIAQFLLEEDADVNFQGGYYSSVLEAASTVGHKNIVQLLLEKGADVNPRGGNQDSALQAASSCGHIDIVRMLLEEGADVNIQGEKNGSALQAAAYKGDEGIVRLLLEEGADVNIKGDKHGSALQKAASQGHEEIVQLLLEKGADVQGQGGQYGNALQAAAYKGCDAVVHTLLDAGADVTTHAGKYGTALQAASLEGHDKIVQLLLDKGADVNFQGGHYGCSLQAAAVKGHDVIVRLLLERGADVNLQGGYYGNAFQAAVIASHDGILEVLLEKGANVNLEGGHFGSALQAALYRGVYAHPIQYFAEREVDANKHGGFYGSLLQAAAIGGQDEDVRLLLEMGADVNFQGGPFGSSLQAASFYGRYTIVHLLLEEGADVNYKGGHYGSALQAASSDPSPYGVALFNMPLMNEAEATEPAAVGARAAIVHLLLENGADVNLQGGPFGSALQAASSYGHINIVRTLLDNGADVTAKGGLYGSALLAALTEDNTDIIRLLVYGQ